MTGARVLQIGIDPEVVDFSPSPGQDADTLRVRLDAALAELRRAGFDVTVCLLPEDVDAAESAIGDAVGGESFDAVEIGSGLRTSHEYSELFETAINAVIEMCPGARLCFNDSPESTLDAVRRVLPPG